MDSVELYKKIKEQKIELTISERMKLYLNGEEVDFLPFSLLAPEDALSNIWGFSLKDLRESFEARIEFTKRKKMEYDIDGYHIGLGLRGMGEIIGTKLFYPENSTDYIHRHFLSEYDALGFIEQYDLYGSEIIKSMLTEADNVSDLFPGIKLSTDVAGPLTTASSIRQIDMILRDIRKKPEQLKSLLSECVRLSLDWVKIFYEFTGCDTVSISDPVTTTDIVPYHIFQEFSKPYMASLVHGIKKITGKSPFVHICGHTKEIWKDLAEIGINTFSLDNRESLEDAKLEIGERMFLTGNVNPVEVLRFGSIDDVISATKACIMQCSDNPMGFMVSSGCQVPIGTPKENIDAFYYAARKYGAGAKKGQKCFGVLE